MAVDKRGLFVISVVIPDWLFFSLVAVGFVVSALAGAGLSWLYAVMTIFKQLKRIFASITAAEEKEEKRIKEEGRKVEDRKGDTP
jgi:hypothetical protein